MTRIINEKTGRLGKKKFLRKIKTTQEAQDNDKNKCVEKERHDNQITQKTTLTFVLYRDGYSGV